MLWVHNNFLVLTVWIDGKRPVRGTVVVSSVQIIIEIVLYSLYWQVEVTHLKVLLHNLKKKHPDSFLSQIWSEPWHIVLSWTKFPRPNPTKQKAITTTNLHACRFTYWMIDNMSGFENVVILFTLMTHVPLHWIILQKYNLLHLII